MRKRLAAMLLIAAAQVSSIAAFAQAPSKPGPIGAPPAGVAPSAPAAGTTVRITGTIEKYDASTRTLTLSTLKGAVRFVLAPVTRIRRDGKTAGVSDLDKLVGLRAAIRYSELAGNKTADSVHVFGKNNFDRAR
jgi:hypothetical protein